jgi:hypothetical protein
MAATVLGNVLDFFTRLGVFDVVLPFLLVFTMMFAVLERTKVLGTEGKDKKESRKNLNAMAAFCIAFLVLASSKLVETVTSVSSNIIILVMLGIFFLLTVGAFFDEGKVVEGITGKTWVHWLFILIMLVGVIVIFLNAIKDDGGKTWWDITVDYVQTQWDSTVFASLALIAFVILFVYLLTKDKGGSEKSAADAGKKAGG